MPLIVEQQPIPAFGSISEFIRKYPQFLPASKRLTAMSPIRVNPDMPYLYVHQLEVACISASDSELDMIGLSEMTTCCCVIVRHTGSLTMGAGHFDGTDTINGLRQIVNGIVRLTNDWKQQSNIDRKDTDTNLQSTRYEVHIVGGFNDCMQTSEEVVMKVFRALHTLDLDLHLETACICAHNTYYQAKEPLPCITSLLCNVKTGQILPASFSYHGPLEKVRKLRFLMNQPIEMQSIYDPIAKILEIKPFVCDITIETIERLLAMAPHEFLVHLSTSPAAEGPNYVDNLREAFILLRNKGDNLFESGKSIKFTRIDGRWKQLEV